MKLDKTAQEVDLASIPEEFRENYKFLCELINCRQKNNNVTEPLEKYLKTGSAILGVNSIGASWEF